MNLAVLPALIDWQPRTRLIFGPGVVARAGALAAELGLDDVLLVCDEGIVRAGYADTRPGASSSASRHPRHPLQRLLREPGRRHSARPARPMARAARVKGIVALGGGSSLDCAKGANFLHADGGEIADFRGYGKVRGTMLPMIGIPTTAGTGSDAQSYAVLSDARTHVKMACGDPGAAFKIALLDPVLTVSQPASVTASSGYDALSHAVEAFVTTVAHAAVADLRARGVAADPRPARPRAAASPTTSTRAAPCCSARTWPAWPSSTRCSAPPTPAPIR